MIRYREDGACVGKYKMSALPAESLVETAMTEPQRQCLLHILRNNASAVQNVITILEKDGYHPSPDELERCLRAVAQSLALMTARFSSGTYCCLAKEQCEFVGHFVGCAPKRCA